MSKKEWERPKLVILTRGEPEEAVLLVCKYYGNNGPNRTQISGCYYLNKIGTMCYACVNYGST